MEAVQSARAREEDDLRDENGYSRRSQEKAASPHSRASSWAEAVCADCRGQGPAAGSWHRCYVNNARGSG